MAKQVIMITFSSNEKVIFSKLKILYYISMTSCLKVHPKAMSNCCFIFLFNFGNYSLTTDETKYKEVIT